MVYRPHPHLRQYSQSGEIVNRRWKPGSRDGGISTLLAGHQASGAALARAKKMLTFMPLPRDDSTLTCALAFWRSDWTISAASLPGAGHSTPSGSPTPSSAMVTWQP